MLYRFQIFTESTDLVDKLKNILKNMDEYKLKIKELNKDMDDLSNKLKNIFNEEEINFIL